MVAPETNYTHHQVPQVTITKVFLSLLAVLGFLLYLFAGLVYMSETYSPKPRSLKVLLHSLTTSNFHLKSRQPLNASEWESTITIKNYHADNIKILINSLESVLYYKDKAFSCASQPKVPIRIQSHKQRTVNLIFKNSSCPDGPSSNPALNDEAIRERCRSGRVRLSMQMKMVLASDIIRSPFSGRFSVLDYRYLEALHVEFVHGIRKGRLVGGDETKLYAERMRSTLMPVNTSSIQRVFWEFEAKRGWMIRDHRGGRCIKI
ncbi:hypothetical protein ACFX13_002627 [Malus domestica]